jgi:hypothetical protein
MGMRTPAIGLGLLAILLFRGSVVSQVAGAADANKVAAAASEQVVLTLRINDTKSGLILDAKRPVAKGSSAFEVLRETVAVKYRTFPKLGVFITGLCGVDAPHGKVWTFSVDGKWSAVGIGGLTLDRDTVIEWVLR